MTPPYLPHSTAPASQSMDLEMDAYLPLAEKKYDVTETSEYVCCFPFVGPSSRTMILRIKRL